MTDELLRVTDLRTYFETRRGVVKAVDGVSFAMRRGEILGLVGESGSGKSITALSIMRLVPKPAGRIAGGSIVLDGVELLALSEAELRAVRGSQVSMVLQDPMTSLNPVYTVGNQVEEVFAYHPGTGPARGNRVVEVLEEVRVSAPGLRVKQYPFQLSGGMRQRVVTGMAVAAAPRLLICDEPTTALDVTIQAQILDLLRRIRDEQGMGIVLITHDLGIVAQLCDRVAVMYAGRIVESGDVERIFTAPQHPYTAGLMASLPRMGEKRRRLPTIAGQPPNLLALPPGCAFAPRCPLQHERCAADPPVTPLADGFVRCWLREEGAPERSILAATEATAAAPVAWAPPNDRDVP